MALLHRTPRRQRLVGLGRPSRGALAAAAFAVSALCLLGYLLFPLVTGHELALRDGWPGLVIGVWLFNGVAEELAWRGHLFGRLRRGRSFGRAVARCRSWR